MAQTIFKNNIASLDFTFKKGNESGVVLIGDPQNTKLTPQEMFALETAKEFQADAVYFRYFDDGREAIPQVYIYDNTAGALSGKEADIHIKVWSGCYIPMFIFVEKSQVRIFDAREKVKIKDEVTVSTPIETIALAGQIFKQFSAKDFDSGIFWEEGKNRNKFQFTTSAYKDLIEGLKKVFDDFQLVSGLNSHVALKLLVQCLLVKYLEERDEEKNTGYFAKTFFKNHFNSNNFCEVIRNGQLLALLDKLAENFNGKIFEWNKDDEKQERNAIQKAKVKKLADYLDGNIKDGQFVLWRLYSFSHLPVELISSVYEELLGKGKKDTVYTPDMIASTLIDECMPLKNPQENFKIIDVSCGSGIFLVKAYKRIIQWWRYQRWCQTGNLERPDQATLQSLLINSIYGIDVQGDAVRLAIFSLALALLDELDPKTIWTKLRFQNLNESNVIEKDFFDFLVSSPPKDFSLVIGNPPFNPPDGLSNGKYKALLKEKYNYESELKIPDHNIALMFLVEGFKLLKEGCLLCLIQPAGPVMYQKDEAFKEAIFSKYNLLQIIDFTKLGDVLWGKANVATAAVFFQNSLPNTEAAAHVIAKRSPANIKKLYLELDHYDFHYVSKDAVIYNQNIWKANSIGGGRVSSLMERLSNARTLRKFLDDKKQDGWVSGEGFIENKNGVVAQYITGKNFLPTEAFTEDGIDWSQITKCKTEKFQRKTNASVFNGPHILIRKVLGTKKLITELVENSLVFKSDIYSIHAPNKEINELRTLADYIETFDNVLRFHILTSSSRAGINKATSIYGEDILNLPYPEKISEIKLSHAEEIIVSDVLDYQFGTGKDKLNKAVTETELKNYAKFFEKTLNSVYKIDGKKFQLLKILDAGNYYALHFEYSSKALSSSIDTNGNLEEYLEALIPSSKKKKDNIHIQRILKFYSKDSIVLSKPKQLRYWLQSVALRDADETFADYLKAGY